MSVSTDLDLRTVAEHGAAELDGASATEVLRWTAETFGDRFIVASNMQDADHAVRSQECQRSDNPAPPDGAGVQSRSEETTS